MNEKQLRRRAFLTSFAAIVGVRVSEVPIGEQLTSHWLHVALRWIPSFGFFVHK
jgi:hypothetical protein